MALHMLLGTATRTPILTLMLFGLFFISSRGSWKRDLPRIALLGMCLAVVFIGYTAFVSDAFWLRIVSADQDDYSSGRVHSIRHWLEIAASNPMGIGAGGVRELLNDGSPYLNGTELLEWPHNEFVRFYVESGPIGLVFLCMFVGYIVRRAVVSARSGLDRGRNALMLIIAADLVAQSIFQNYFNTIYHATILIMILAVSSVGAALEQDEDDVEEQVDGHSHTLASPHTLASGVRGFQGRRVTKPLACARGN